MCCIPAAVAQVSADARFLWVSHQYAEWVGAPRDQIVGRLTDATAKDGPGALAAVKTFHPEVAILDIGLPVMDGYELATRLRASLGDTTPPLIALTGYGKDSERARAREAGFSQHLTKPVDFDRLLGVLDPARSGAEQRTGAP